MGRFVSGLSWFGRGAREREELTWRRRLKGMQAVKVSLLRNEFRKRGQLASV